MLLIIFKFLIIGTAITAINSQTNYLYGEYEYKCPEHWVRYQETCYRFNKSPMRPKDEASRNCKAQQSNLVNIRSPDVHTFITLQFSRGDIHQKWYTGVRMQGGSWVNEDGSQFSMENAILSNRLDYVYGKENLVYAYNEEEQRWDFERVTGLEPLFYICEAPITILYNLVEENRTYQYGFEVNDPLRIPRGPYFIKQPENKIFDITKRVNNNDVTLSCLAGGYPTPTYEWFKEDFQNDRSVARKINPLLDERYTLSGGSLIIFSPNQVK